MREMGWSWHEYLEAPTSVRDFIIDDMIARAKKKPGPH